MKHSGCVRHFSRRYSAIVWKGTRIVEGVRHKLEWKCASQVQPTRGMADI